jgi:4-amino-4-deoxy-L-arabinose transferase-like glycosyltransferase
LPATLPLWLALPALAFMLLVPGFLTFQLILSTRKSKLVTPAETPGQTLNASKLLTAGEQVFWTLALGTFEAGWLALLLAEWGQFSIELELLFLAVWSLAAFGWLWQRGYRGEWWREKFANMRPRWGRQHIQGWLLTGLIAGSTFLFFLAPHETILGGQDSGVYFNTGANIALTGEIISTDPLVPVINQVGQDPQVGPIVISQFLSGVAKQESRFLFVRNYRLPGFFIFNNLEGLSTGAVVPSFFHLYPAYLALGFGLDGSRGITLVTPFLGVLAVFALYLVAQRLFPTRKQRWIAPLAALFMALNAIQVWFARQSLWEMLGAFLIFSGIYGFLLMLRPLKLAEVEDEQGRATAAAVSPALARLGALGVGIAFGLICLAHAQFPFLVWPLAPYLLWVRLTRRWQAHHWWLLISFALLALHSIIHIRIFSLGYFEGIYHNVIVFYMQIIGLIIGAGAVGLFLFILVDALPGRVRAFEGWLKSHWRIISGVLALLTFVYLIYNYFIRVYGISTDGQGNYPTWYWSLSSYIGAPATEGPERTLVRIGWYFSPPAMLLIFGGLIWLVWKRLNSRTAIFMAILAGITVFFIDTNYTQEHYIYSLRRFAVVTVPGFSIALAYVLGGLLPYLPAALSRLRLPRRTRRVALAPETGTGGNSNIAFTVVSQPEPQAAGSSGGIQVERSAGNTRWGWWLGIGSAALLVVFMVYTGRTIYTLSEYGSGDGQPGLIAQMDQLAAQFGPKDILLFAGSRDIDGKIAAPLTYVYDHPAFVLTDALKNDETAAVLDRWVAQGYHLKALLGPNGGRFYPPGYNMKFDSAVTITLRQLEDLTTQKPYNVQLNTLSYAIYDLEKVGSNQAGSFSQSAGSGQPDTAPGWSLTTGQNDYAALVQGFYETEKDTDGTPYRWIQSTGVLRIPCMVPEGAGGKLTITLAGGKRPASLPGASVGVFVSNYRYSDDTKLWQSLGTLQPGETARTYTLTLPAGAAALSCAKAETGGSVNSLFLWLVPGAGTPFTPANFGGSVDSRMLSLKFYGLNVSNK